MWFVVPPIKNVKVYVWNRFGGILKDSIDCPLNGFGWPFRNALMASVMLGYGEAILALA